jgi:acyl-CoA synthetase (NDP forming)
LLEPKTIAVVGANERLLSELAVPEILRSAAEVSLVSRTHRALYGQETFPSLSAVGHPVDAVFVMTGAAQAAGIAREAAELGCGGIIVVGGGFSESGPDGVARQAELKSHARSAELAILGPNCLGFVNASRGIHCSLIGRMPARSGRVAVLSQSGYLLRAALNAGYERQIGFSHAVSSGNEADVTILDLINYSAEDDATDVICLIIEQIPSWRGLLEAVSRAHRAGKPVIAVKLGRTPLARQAIRSHTGAIASEGWVYEVAFRQAGILTAPDLDSLLDQAQLFAGLPRSRWRTAESVAIVANSGGTASLAADLCTEQGVSLPALDALAPWIRQQIGMQALANPLDLTGAALSDVTLLQAIFQQYGGQPEVDAVLFCSGLAAHDERRANPLGAFAAAARSNSAIFIATCAEASALADWVPGKLEGTDVAYTRGVGSAVRAIQAMNAYLRRPGAAAHPPSPAHLPSAARRRQRPAATVAVTDTYLCEGSRFMRFGAGMELLRSVGIPAARYRLIGGDDAARPRIPRDFGERVVVKLANVPHRTELGAVQTNVPVARVRQEAQALRTLAARLGLDGQVACQPFLRGDAELFVGLKAHEEFGQVLVVGLGGVTVEQSACLTGRILPLTAEQREELVDEFGELSRLAAARGGVLWNRAALIALVDSIEQLARAASGWLESLDINPLIMSADGVVAVDVACVVASDAGGQHGTADPANA